LSIDEFTTNLRSAKLNHDTFTEWNFEHRQDRIIVNPKPQAY